MIYGDSARIPLGKGNTLVLLFVTGAVHVIYEPGTPGTPCQLGVTEIDATIAELNRFRAALVEGW